MRAFSYGECLICRDEMCTSHTPCDVFCDVCSEDFNLCESCGNKIDKDE